MRTGSRLHMEHKFIVTYSVDGDVPICPDHLHKQLDRAVQMLQGDIDAKELPGFHSLKLQAGGPWFPAEMKPIYFKLEPQASGEKLQAAGAMKLTQLNDIEEIC